MADIRQNATVKDDFNRANESPLSGGGNWAQTDTANPPMILVSEKVRHTTNDSCFSHWTPDPALNGDDAECWASIIGNEIAGAAWGVGIFRQVGGTNAADGYLFRIETSNVSDVYRLWRATDWVFTSIGITGDVAPEGFPCILLIRRNGNDVECWSDETGVGDAFSLRLAVTDTTHTTGFYPTLHTDQVGSSTTIFLDNFGSGSTEEFIPQIYRRVFG